MDTGTSMSGQLAPNLVLLELRKSKGWGRPRLAKELHNFCLARHWASPGEANLAKQIYRLETGRIRTPDDFYTRLYCQYYQMTEHELFGRVGPAVPMSPTYKVRSHKFIPAYVGAENAQAIRELKAVPLDDTQWSECHREHMADNGNSYTLYTWPFGVAMYHLVEEIAPRSIAEISVWRSISYRENITWASNQLSTMADGGITNEPYVLSAYWVESTPWEDARLDTALRLLCIPAR